MQKFLKESETKQLEALIAWASIAYTAGFLTVMAHTSRLGIPVIELIKPVYIWIGFPLAVVIFSTRWVFRIVKSRYENFTTEMLSITEKIRASLKKQEIESENNDENDVKILLEELLKVMLEIVPMGLILSGIYDEIGIIEKVVSKTLKKIIAKPKFRFYLEKWLLASSYSVKAFQSVNRFISFTAIISLIPIGCYFYIFSLYPTIPQSIGGGRPADVILFVNSEKIPPDLENVRKLFPSNTNWTDKTIASKELELYYTTNTYYFVRESEDTIISLNKNSIEGIMWQDSN